MRRRILKHPRAVIDLTEIAEYVSNDSLDAAIRFLEEAEATFKQLAEMPGMGRLREFPGPRWRGVRSWSVNGFPNHLIFYRATPQGIEVLRVLHGARDLPSEFR